MTTGIQCKPESNLPQVEKVNHLAIRLGGATPDGVFNGGSVTIDLNSQAAKNLEAAIGYNSTLKGSQPTLLAQHWSEVRALVESFQSLSQSKTIAQSSLSVVGPNSAFKGDTANAAQLRAGVLIESAAMLIDIFGQTSACSSGDLPRLAGTPAEISPELPYLTTVASLYVRMGGEIDDGGLPDGALSAPATLTDSDLRDIDALLSYSPSSSTDPLVGLVTPPLTELQKNWSGVRQMITGLRNPAGLIDNGTLTTAIQDPKTRSTAAVQIQTVVGVLRILRSEDWKAGRAYGSDEELVPSGIPHTAGADYIVPLPAGSKKWAAGDKITIDGEPLKKNLKGLSEVSIPGSLLPQGAHTIEVSRGGKVVATITLASADSFWTKAESFVTNYWPQMAGGAALLGIAGYLLFRNRKPTSAGPGVLGVKINPSSPPPPTVQGPTTGSPNAGTTSMDHLLASIPHDPQVTVEKQTFSIGRNSDAEIPLNVKKMDQLKASMLSGKHVTITSENGVFSALDIGNNKDMAYVERAGVFLALSRDTGAPTVLQPGDVLEIAGERIQFMGTPSDPTKPATAFGEAVNVLASRSLILQNNPVAAAAGNGTNGSNHVNGTLPTADDVKQKLIDNFPSSMKSADGKAIHSDYEARLNDMVKKVMAEPALSAISLDAIAARTSSETFSEWSSKKSPYSFEQKLEFIRLADMAEQKAKALEKTIVRR